MARDPGRARGRRGGCCLMWSHRTKQPFTRVVSLRLPAAHPRAPMDPRMDPTGVGALHGSGVSDLRCNTRTKVPMRMLTKVLNMTTRNSPCAAVQNGKTKVVCIKHRLGVVIVIYFLCWCYLNLPVICVLPPHSNHTLFTCSHNYHS